MIQTIEKHAQDIADGKHDTVRPGQPGRISEAAQVGDYAWQGDLMLKIVDCVPDGYVAVYPDLVRDLQLVPGNTQGARHWLDSLEGVELHRPEGWGDSYEGLEGPCLVLSEERTVTHPVHGDISIPKGFTVLCRYQREYNAEQRRERRNSD